MKELLLALALLLSPRAAHRPEVLAIVDATDYAVEHDADAPIFGSREADAAVLLATAYFESRFALHAVGDHGRSLGAFQLQRPEGGGDPRTQAVTALRLLHWSASVCPDLPAAAYLSGRCNRARAQAGRRMNAIARLVERISADGVAERQP